MKKFTLVTSHHDVVIDQCMINDIWPSMLWLGVRKLDVSVSSSVCMPTWPCVSVYRWWPAWLSVCLSLCIHDAVCLYLDGDLVTLADSSLSEFLESLSKFTRYSALPSVLWCCWLGGRKAIRPVKKPWAVGCWRVCLAGARCRLAYSPAADATHCLLLQ